MNSTLNPVVTLPSFDLSYVIEQLSAKPEFAEWTKERFAAAVLRYRRFLALCKALDGEKLSPSADADELWHRHMLNSRRYVADCLEYFGYYLHHEPIEIQPTESEIAANHARMSELYYLTFGEKSDGADANCSYCSGGNECSRCQGCKETR